MQQINDLEESKRHSLQLFQHFLSRVAFSKRDGKEKFSSLWIATLNGIFAFHSWNHFVAFAKTETFRLHVSLNSRYHCMIYAYNRTTKVFFEVFPVESSVEERWKLIAIKISSHAKLKTMWWKRKFRISNRRNWITSTFHYKCNSLSAEKSCHFRFVNYIFQFKSCFYITWLNCMSYLEDFLGLLK